MFNSLISLALLAGAIASPLRLDSRALKTTQSDITIHQSCNATQRRMLEKALSETWEVASFAKEYVQKNGPNDTVFQTYFGTKPQAYSAVLGVWDSFLYSDKTGVLLRCDNIDGNCGQPGWRGHWRGNNGSAETVICDASYTDRKFNSAFCMGGYQLEKTAPSYYWSVDLIHRLFHVPQVTNGAVDHYAEGMSGVLELAQKNSTWSPYDSNALQFFATHVYAQEVVQAGSSCIGNIGAASSVSNTPSSSASAATASSTSSSSSGGKDCHTHADGTVHCV